MLKVARSDSMDQTLDLINASFHKFVNVLTHSPRQVVSKLNLKLLDGNKEIEYNQIQQQMFDGGKLLWLLWAQVLMYVSIAIFKVWNTFAGHVGGPSPQGDGADGTGKEDGEASSHTEPSADGAGAPMPTVYSLQLVSTLYMELIEIFVLMLAIYVIKRTNLLRKDWIIHAVILFLHMIVNVYFFLDPRNPIIHVQFIFVVMFTHHNRMNSFFFVMWITFFSLILYINIRISVLQEKEKLKNQGYQIEWFFSSVTLTCLLWIYQSYRDEIKKKIEFVADFRAGKELQKLKSIINILIPSLVRQRVQDGKKNFSDYEPEVTVVFVDIADFDEIVQRYSGKELLELLDVVFNGLDQLCEMYGIYKIETVGKTYMACGGLKVCERDVAADREDNHHSVNVTDFALSAISFASTVQLRFGHYLGLKIGIHSGPVITGVVGDTKP